MLNFFKRKKKTEAESSPKNDAFQADRPGVEPAVPKVSKNVVEPSVKEVNDYENELLLRGRIGISTGSPDSEKPGKEEKPAKEPSKKETPRDKIETEYAQIMKININNKLDSGE